MGTDLYQFAVVGGDLRQWYLADRLAERGYRVLTYDLCKEEKIPRAKAASSVKELTNAADVLIYPIPFLKQKGVSGIEISKRKEVLLNLREGQFFFAGGILKIFRFPLSVACHGVLHQGSMPSSQSRIRDICGACAIQIFWAIKPASRRLTAC